MTEKNQFTHIDIGIQMTNLVKSTLGPRGMNKMVMKDKNPILTNDGATIIKNVKLEHPLGNAFKQVAESQENAVGDGTTSSMVILGGLLENAKKLIEKGIHPTNIISGYSQAANLSLNLIKNFEFDGDKKQIIKTCFGSKISPALSEHLANLLIDIDLKNIRAYKNSSSNPLDSEIIDGYIFNGFTINEQMPQKVVGNVAVLDTRNHLEITKIEVNTADELEKVNKKNREYKENIAKNLYDLGVKCVFITDTNPEIETFLTKYGLAGCVVYDREIISDICFSTGAKVIGNPEFISKEYLGEAEVEFGFYPKNCYLKSKNSKIKTLKLCGSTDHTLDETQRAVDDVIGILKNSDKVVYGGGNFEVQLAKGVRKYAENVPGKEKLAVLAFAEALEEIPITLAKNCGFDGIEVLTTLQNNPDFGVDINLIISDVKKRGIVEPSLIKKHAIISATELANHTLKLDDIYVGDE